MPVAPSFLLGEIAHTAAQLRCLHEQFRSDDQPDDRANHFQDRSLRSHLTAVTTINDLLFPDLSLRRYASPEMDPLTEADALQDAQVLDVRLDAVTGVAGILFELRQALQLDEANTGVLVARGVRGLTWTGASRTTRLTAWSIGSSVPSRENQFLSLKLVMWPHPGAELTLTAESAAFFVGDVPGLPATPPDYGGGDRRMIATEVAGWDSPFRLVSAVFLDPAGGAANGSR